MKITKNDFCYFTTEQDLTFGEQITLDGELLIPISALEKIRAEIEQQEKWLMDAGYNQYNVDIAFNAVKLAVDKYNADKKDCTTCIGFGDKTYAQSFCYDCIKDIQNHYKADKEKEE